MGLGVFAGADICEGELLDEYFGELIPPRMAAARTDDNYSFQVRGVASSSARDYANWTRFVNHSCRDYNVEAVNDVLGGRRTITFRALRRIEPGEELLIDYGVKYFGDAEGEIMCRCSAFPQPHIPPNQTDKALQTQRAFPGPSATPNAIKPPDITISQQDDWIARHKGWLGTRHPKGYSRWTMVHWRLLEQLIRRRWRNKDWRSKPEFKGLPSSRGDPLLAFEVQRENSRMTIFQWHLDVVKAFQQDNVCGTKDGKQWETTDVLKRLFAVNVAARRRRKRSERKGSAATTPPLVQGPATIRPTKTPPRNIPTTPPRTGKPEKTSGIRYPDLPSDVPEPPSGLPTPPATIRQAKRAVARRRRRQQRSYNTWHANQQFSTSRED